MADVEILYTPWQSELYTIIAGGNKVVEWIERKGIVHHVNVSTF